MEESDRSYRGFNFFEPDDRLLFEALSRGEFNIRVLGWVSAGGCSNQFLNNLVELAPPCHRSICRSR